ncbi:hypothetical protein RF11_11584 [Thelohanellus kitauei]|uniref:Uncharacterized protein n=1 Tax=Thelohanellus kitauei TaxID=669202 RepID=A0A0C2J5E5_THEKT|nr:hypothetical protein RF11_11584 [Thelohanellus kitauei]
MQTDQSNSNINEVSDITFKSTLTSNKRVISDIDVDLRVKKLMDHVGLLLILIKINKKIYLYGQNSSLVNDDTALLSSPKKVQNTDVNNAQFSWFKRLGYTSKNTKGKSQNHRDDHES